MRRSRLWKMSSCVNNCPRVIGWWWQLFLAIVTTPSSRENARPQSICGAMKDASCAAFELRKSRLLSSTTFEGIFKLGQPRCAECDQQVQPLKDAAPELGHSNCLRDARLCDCRSRCHISFFCLFVQFIDRLHVTGRK